MQPETEIEKETPYLYPYNWFPYEEPSNKYRLNNIPQVVTIENLRTCMDVLEGPLQAHPVPRITEVASVVGSTVLEFSLGSKACGGNSTDLENGELWADDIFTTSTVRNEREERESWEWEHPGWDYDDKEEYERQYLEWHQYEEDVDEVLEGNDIVVGGQVLQVAPIVQYRSIGTQTELQVELESEHNSIASSSTSTDEDYVEESTSTNSTISTSGTNSIEVHEDSTGSQRSTSTRSNTSTNHQQSSGQGSKESTSTSKGTCTNNRNEETNAETDQESEPESLHGTTTTTTDILLRLSAVEDRRIWDALVEAEKVKFVAISNDDLDDLELTDTEHSDTISCVTSSPSISSNTDYPCQQPVFPFATLSKARFHTESYFSTNIKQESTSTT
jgi:hypothetical protein